ncbi:WXG100 family type VII secretion target [Nocardia sp. BMG111209]|uniref:WXG100 family type VII secretion target n=1 Tax=Nocardia sp. BMG111209 TaxID=1160137 RepID=UPI00036EBECF|nr:WXG100 family type VII secretion target [Nocardia sp. BMG111209]
MPGPQIQQNESTASGAQTAMADAVAAIRAKINAITTAVEDAKRGWQGDAFDACNTAADNWETEATALNKTLDDLQAEVGTSVHTYSGMEGDNTQFFTTLGVAAPS